MFLSTYIILLFLIPDNIIIHIKCFVDVIFISQKDEGILASATETCG